MIVIFVVPITMSYFGGNQFSSLKNIAERRRRLDFCNIVELFCITHTLDGGKPIAVN